VIAPMATPAKFELIFPADVAEAFALLPAHDESVGSTVIPAKAAAETSRK